MPAPRRQGSTIHATAADPATVSTPKPTPRTAEHASTHHSADETPVASAGRPSSTIPATSTRAHPCRRSSVGTKPCVATVAASITALTRPAPPVPAPPATTHIGATASSAA